MVRRNREERSARRGRGRKGVMSVDLSNVETYTPMEEGKHLLKVVEIEEKEGDAGPYWAWKFEAAAKDGPSGSVIHNTSFAKQALFNLKSLLESLQVDIPDSEFDLVIDDMIGLEMMAEIAHEDVETDNGTRRYGRIVDHWPATEEDDKPGKKKDKEEHPVRKSSKKKDVTAEDVNEMSQDELEELIEAHKLDIDLGDFRTVSKMRAGVIDALTDAGVIEGEEEPEEDDRPSRQGRRGSSRSRSKEEEEPEEDEPEERPARRRRR